MVSEKGGQTRKYLRVGQVSRLYGKHYNTILRHIWMGRLRYKMTTNEKNAPTYAIELESLQQLAASKSPPWVVVDHSVLEGVEVV